MKKLSSIFLTAGIMLLTLCPVQLTASAVENVIYEQNFDVPDMSYREVGEEAFISSLATEQGSISFSFGNYAVQYPKEFTADDQAQKNFLNENNDFVIENGRLKIAKDANHGNVANTIKFNFPKTTGQILVSYDLAVEQYSGYSTSGINLNGTDGSFVASGMISYCVYLGWSNTGDYKFGDSYTYFSDKKPHRVEYLVDLDTKQYWGYCDGLITTGAKSTGKVSNLNLLMFATSCTGNEENTVFYIDNLKVEKMASPKIAATNMPSTQTPVPLDSFYLDFDMPMNAESLEQIKMYKDDVRLEEIDYQLTNDGTRLTLNTLLDYSSIYRVEIEERTVMGENRFYIPTTKYLIYTKHKDTPVTMPEGVEPMFMNENYEPISKLDGCTTLRLDTALKSTSGEQDVMLLLVQYENGTKVKKIAHKKVKLADGVLTPVSISLDLAETEGTSRVYGYFWCGERLMEAAAPAVSIG